MTGTACPPCWYWPGGFDTSKRVNSRAEAIARAFCRDYGDDPDREAPVPWNGPGPETGPRWWWWLRPAGVALAALEDAAKGGEHG